MALMVANDAVPFLYYVSLQASGIGKLKPNILLMGFKENWQTSERNEIVDYVEVMQ